MRRPRRARWLMRIHNDPDCAAPRTKTTFCSTMLTFQQMILKLQSYWADHGLRTAPAL